MSKTADSMALTVSNCQGHCPIGEIVGKENSETGKIPVYSCEGACIRGEIARRAANLVAKKDPYRRGCHGELLSVPHSAIARWTRAADKVVLIDGCFLRCHGRIIEHLIDADRLIQFDALSHYRAYNDIFDMDDVAEDEKQQVVTAVAEWVLQTLASNGNGDIAQTQHAGCSSSCCG